MSTFFQPTLEFASEMDAKDPLSRFRKEFTFPDWGTGAVLYFCGNSLGLEPQRTSSLFLRELDNWKKWGVDGYSKSESPWIYYHEQFLEPLSKIVGGFPQEIAVMNALTVNLHLLLATFYKPTSSRYKIIVEGKAFPSDQYAMASQIKFHGLDPKKTLVELFPRKGEALLREEDILECISANSNELALVFLGGLNYYTGQFLNMEQIAEETHRAGGLVGFDLAHVIGNIPLKLNAWQIDFAVWCSYKYLNAGPGAVGGLFIHQRHCSNTDLNRLAGWWGNDEKIRFQMENQFFPKPSASGWSVSTAPVFNMIGLKASLELFEQTDINLLRVKSILLTDFLEFLLHQLTHLNFEILTPKQSSHRGAQLSIQFERDGKEVFQKMRDRNVVIDYREPNVIRIAPAPFYNTFTEVFQLYYILKALG